MAYNSLPWSLVNVSGSIRLESHSFQVVTLLTICFYWNHQWGISTTWNNSKILTEILTHLNADQSFFFLTVALGRDKNYLDLIHKKKRWFKNYRPLQWQEAPVTNVNWLLNCCCFLPFPSSIRKNLTTRKSKNFSRASFCLGLKAPRTRSLQITFLFSTIISFR